MTHTTTNDALTIKSGKTIIDRVYHHAHNIGKSTYKNHQQAAIAMHSFWSRLVFAQGSVGEEWQDCGLNMLSAIKHERYTGYDAIERLHSMCGMLNQTLRLATNLEGEA